MERRSSHTTSGVVVGSTALAPAAVHVWERVLISVSDFVDRIATAIFVVGTAAFATVMLLGVFFRYVINRSLPWSDELALVIFAWSTFLAISCGYLHDKHVNIDFLLRKLPPLLNAPASVLAEGLAGGYLASLLVAGIQALEIAQRSHTDALQLPMTVPYLAIPVASALMMIHWLRRNLVGKTARSGLAKLAIVIGFYWLVFLPLGQYVRLSGEPRALVLVLALFGPMLLGVPVALCLGLMATLYLSMFGNVPIQNSALQIFYGINIVALMAIPLLILAGRLMHSAGIAKLMVDFAQVLVGRVRGGLGAANVVASFLFGDISGSAVSDTAAIGSLMIPQMKARGYKSDFCAALQGAAGTLGMMAPLSITVLLYCSATNGSVSRLAAAMIAPAFLVAFSFMAITIVHARRNNYPRESVPASEYLPRTLKALPGLFALVVVVGGILGGVFTPAEVGSVLFFYILILSVFLYHTVQPRSLYDSFVEAGYISGMTLFMASTSSFLGFVLARDLVSIQVVDAVSQISVDRYAVLAMVTVVFIILGMFLEPPAMIFGFLPSFIPLLTHAGIDMVHWGVLFAVNMGLGCIIPPVAMNLFVSTELAGEQYERVIRATVPFIVIMSVDLVVMAVFPQIPLQIPHILFGYPIK